MDISIAKFNILDANIYKIIWKAAFQSDEVGDSFPHDMDDTISIKLENNEIIGFCMVHPDTPYKFTKAPNATNYLYNLCILPEYQNKGYATKLLDFCKNHYKTLSIHLTVNDKNLQWLHNRGFSVLDVWRGIYIEHIYPSMEEFKKEVVVPEISQHYDYEENIMYLQP